MSTLTIRRPCPTCLPAERCRELRTSGAHYDYHHRTEDGSGAYRCRNCSREIIVRKRPRKPGGPGQTRTMSRIREIAGSRDVSVRESAGGALIVVVRGEWPYSDSVMVCVGANGGLEDCEVIGREDVEKTSGRGAWITLEVYARDWHRKEAR